MPNKPAMRILSVGKKPLAASRWLRVCQGSALVGFLLTLNSMLHTTGLSFTLFTALGTPLLLLSAAVVLVLLLDDLRKRYSLFDLEEYEAGEIIFRQGDLADRVYFIQKGEVEVVRTVAGKETVLARLSSGEFFGEMAFFVSDGRRTASVRTTTPVDLLALGKENFARLMHAVPAVHKEFSAKASQRIKEQSR